jgi:MerR family copper efflux transcriptional regulator
LKDYGDHVTTALKIKEVAERSGFSTATLRYYEDIGLMPPPERTPAGYRVYTEQAIARLAFIARAKQLGCSLDEISDLAAAWDGGSCGPVQDRLRSVVAEKLAETQGRMVELTTLTAELQQAAAALERHRPDGPCDERCGCTSDPAGEQPAQARAITFVSKRAADTEAAPIACTLGAESLRGRLDDWNALLAHVERRDAIEGGVRLTFGASTPTAELMRLASAEQDCCQFFTFAITIDARGIALEVTAPHDALAVVQALFGTAA